MPRYKLTIAYDGTDFCGWQKQEPFAHTEGAPLQSIPSASRGVASEVQGTIQREGEDRPRVQLRTVQHAVEQAVREIVREPVMLQGASRTDAGVHAKGQVAAFTCSGDELASAVDADSGTGVPAVQSQGGTGAPPVLNSRASGGWPLSRGTDRLLQALNGRLPDDILISACDPVPLSFDPIADCSAKAYSYTILASRARALWDRRYVTQIWEPLDAAAMHAAAQRFVGEHDFAAFAAAGHGRLTTVRTVFSCDVDPLPQDRIRLTISGSGFLYNMVRIIAGTLVEIGKGRMTPDDVTAAIEGKDRRAAGPTMPPQGLCLEWIKYRSAAISM